MSDQRSRRLLSLDVFRGLTIAGMTVVNSPGNGSAYAAIEHAAWNGCTLADLVFPFFIFIVGVSLVFSFARRRESGQDRPDLLRQIVGRTVIIFALGLFLNGFPTYHLDALRISGVLQRIAICYFFAAVLYLYLDVKALVGVAAATLIGYWYLMTHVALAGGIPGDLSPAGNLAAFVDRRWLPRPFYTPDYDPEGILSTFPAIVTALLGVLTGHGLYGAFGPSGDASRKRRSVAYLGVAGVAGLVAGLIWNRWFPINKQIWTSSYVLFTGGVALLILAFCIWRIEIQTRGAWLRGFEVFGVNGIIAYVLPILDLKIQNRIPVLNPDGTAGNLRLLITRHLFEGWTSLPMASLLYALAHTLLWFFLLRALYRRRIFIKI